MSERTGIENRLTRHVACLRALQQDARSAQEPRLLADLDAWGLVWTLDDGDPVRLTHAGEQVLARAGAVGNQVLTYLPHWIDDLHAREALLEAATVLVDDFRTALADGEGVLFALDLVPDVYAEHVDDRLAVNLFAAAISLTTRLGQDLAAACLAEELMAVALIVQATHLLEDGRLDAAALSTAVRALDGLFDLFQDDDVLAVGHGDPHDPEDGPDPQAPHTWFAPWGGVRVEGTYLQEQDPPRFAPEWRVTRIPLHLSVDPGWDLVEVLAFGTICDQLPRERYLALVDNRAAFVVDPSGCEIVGFVIHGYSELSASELETPELWRAPRFAVPVLGLVDASVGEILTAIRGRFAPGEPTADAMHAHAAMDEKDPARALPHWQLALEAGDMKAHYGLGYTLCGLGRHRSAYDHLRRYTELTPTNAWAWCWLGQACAGKGDRDEARAALREAIRLDADGTDAAQWLARLG